MRCRACGTTVGEPGGMSLCPACAAVTGNPREPARSASTSALWLWTSPHAATALATGDLGVMIRTWRQATGTSQLALAEKLGYDPSYISMIETGRRDVVDIANRRRIAQHLGIPLHRVGVTDTEAADHVTMLQFGYSTLRLATLARHAGHGAAAVNELWPLVARLEARAADAIIDKDMLLLLARARAELGVSLGYVLPEERLAFAVRWTGRALRVAEHLDDPDLHAYTLRAYGNELRKAGRTSAALVRLAHAVAVAGPNERPPALVQLARAAQDPATFDATLTELHRNQDHPASDDPLVSPTAVREVHLRGLIATGRAQQAITLLSASHAPAPPASPQWRIIEQITVAEVLLAAGDVTAGESALLDAIGGAERHRLPHQIQRAARAAAEHCPAVVEAASAALGRTTAPTAGYPSPARILGHRRHRRLDRLGQREPDREPHIHALDTRPANMAQPCLRRPGAVGTDQDRGAVTVLVGDLRDRHVSDRDMVGGGVRSSVAVTQQTSEDLVGVVQETHQRVIAEGALERLVRAFLLRVADHQRSIEVEDQATDHTSSSPRRRVRDSSGLRALRPGDLPRVCPRRSQPRQHDGVHRVQDAPRRRGRGDRAEQCALVTQHHQIGDRLTTISDRHRKICPHPTRIMTSAFTLTRANQRDPPRTGGAELVGQSTHGVTA